MDTALMPLLITCVVQIQKKSKTHNQMHESYRTRERLKKLTTDSVNETLGLTSIPIVSCSCNASISVGHAFFDMYDFKPTYRPRAYPVRITKNWMREEAMPDSMSGNRSRTCFCALCIGEKKIKIKRSDGYRCGGGAIPKRTYPVASDFVRPDQLAIEAEIRPLLRIGACVGTCSCGIAVIRGVGGCGSVVGLRHDGRGGYVCPPSSCI